MLPKKLFGFPTTFIKSLLMIHSPGCVEKPTTEVRLQSNSKISRHIANCYKTARGPGRGKYDSFQSERKENFDLKKYFYWAVIHIK